MEDYTPKSNASKELEARKIQKVVSSPVKVKKKSGLTKFADVFVQEDGQNVKNYIFSEVLIPALKKLFDDVVTNALHMFLYGEDSRYDRSHSPSSKISYLGSYYNYSKNETPRYSPTGFDFDDVVIRSKGEAEEVLYRMSEILDKYKVVTVADYNEMVGITGPYTSNRYGWTSLRTATIVRVRDGYIIRLPKAMPID